MNSIDFNSFYDRLTKGGHVSSQKNLALILGVDSSAISQAKKRNSIPFSWFTILSKKLDLNPEWIQTGIGDKRLNEPDDFKTMFEMIPKVKARLSAGGGSFDIEPDIIGYFSFQKEWLRKKGNSKKMVLMDIFGNSMEPELKDGDTILVDLSKNEILAGAIYAIGIDDTVMVKRIEKLPEKLVLISDNRSYSPTYLKG